MRPSSIATMEPRYYFISPIYLQKTRTNSKRDWLSIRLRSRDDEKEGGSSLSAYLPEALTGVKTSSQRGSLSSRTLNRGKESSLRLEVKAIDSKPSPVFDPSPRVSEKMFPCSSRTIPLLYSKVIADNLLCNILQTL